MNTQENRIKPCQLLYTRLCEYALVRLANTRLADYVRTRVYGYTGQRTLVSRDYYNNGLHYFKWLVYFIQGVETTNV